MIRSVLIILVLFSTVGASAQSSDASWLQRLPGTWEAVVRGERYVETWTCSDGTCNGQATSYRGDSVVMTENTRIMAFQGQWLFLVAAGDGPVVCFVREERTEDTWVFTNREHDFPQRIGYTLAKPDVLNAWIEGPGAKGPMRLPFDLKRVQ